MLKTGLFVGVALYGLLAASNSSAEVMTLDQCIQRALQTNGSSQYGLPQSLDSYHRSTQGVWTAWGNLLPTLNNSYRGSHTKFPPDSTFNPSTGQWVHSVGSSTSWSSSFSLNQTLFNGGANWYQVGQSYHSRAGSWENLRGAENGLVLGVKEAYFNLLKATKLVTVQEAAVKRAEQFHKTIESKYELGSASLSEVLKAKVQLGTEQLALLQRQTDVRTSTATLNAILNRAVDDTLELADVDSVGPPPISYEDALAIAAKESPSIRSARFNVSSAKDDVGIARSTLFPTFSWSVSRSYTPATGGDLLKFKSGDASTSVGFSIGYQLFDAFHWKTQISNARVGLKYARESEQQVEKATELAVKQAFLGVDLANESRKLAQQTEESAQEDFNLAQEKYNLGAATILDLLDAQASLTLAQTSYVNSLYDQYVAVARLDNAMGRR
jgi:outer membrane protein TolC